MKTKITTHTGETGGYSVRSSVKGWIVETWSRVSGQVSGRKVLVPYRDWPACIDLDQPGLYGTPTAAEHLVRVARYPECSRTLRRGEAVS